ncbi:lim domain containing protein [Moniliophthora roreri]|nr:lim domain containing protein [Moniliophthora roreri]
MGSRLFQKAFLRPKHIPLPWPTSIQVSCPSESSRYIRDVGKYMGAWHVRTEEEAREELNVSEKPDMGRGLAFHAAGKDSEKTLGKGNATADPVFSWSSFPH